MTREQRTLEAMRKNPMKYVKQFLPKPWYNKKIWREIIKPLAIEIVGVTIAILIAEYILHLMR